MPGKRGTPKARYESNNKKDDKKTVSYQPKAGPGLARDPKDERSARAKREGRPEQTPVTLHLLARTGLFDNPKKEMRDASVPKHAQKMSKNSNMDNRHLNMAKGGLAYAKGKKKGK